MRIRIEGNIDIWCLSLVHYKTNYFKGNKMYFFGFYKEISVATNPSGIVKQLNLR